MGFKKLTISIFIFFVYTSAANAADVYFNDVYPITNDEVNSSTLGTKLTGRNFKFSNNQVQFSGNDVSGTFSYYDFSGNLVSINGIISRKTVQGGSSTTSVYFSNATFKYQFVIPGNESLFVTGQNYNTNSSGVGDDLQIAVSAAP